MSRGPHLICKLPSAGWEEILEARSGASDEGMAVGVLVGRLAKAGDVERVGRCAERRDMLREEEGIGDLENITGWTSRFWK